MPKSSVLDNFIKIAEKKGIIAKADHAEHTEKDFHETNPRMDSYSIEQIGKLYNVKPNLPEDMKYEHNIMEDAHPDPLVISPSHDKLNGLIENEIEGQNIRMRIVMKTPDGLSTHRKYAEKQLLLSLVRTANDLDNRNQEALRKLADVCLLQASGKQLKKVAIAPLIYGICAAIGVIYAKQHARFHSDGFTEDYKKAMAEIDNLLKANSNWGVGYTYTPAFIATVNKLKAAIARFYAPAQKFLSLIAQIQTPRTVEELKALAQQPKTHEVETCFAAFNEAYTKLAPFISSVIADFGDEGFKQRAIAEKGWMSSVIDSAEVLHGGKGLIADDFDDVKHALETLQVDIVKLETDMTNAQKTYSNAKRSATAQITAATTKPAEAVPAETVPEAKPAESSLDKLDELGKSFGM